MYDVSLFEAASDIFSRCASLTTLPLFFLDIFSFVCLECVFPLADFLSFSRTSGRFAGLFSPLNCDATSSRFIGLFSPSRASPRDRVSTSSHTISEDNHSYFSAIVYDPDPEAYCSRISEPYSELTHSTGSQSCADRKCMIWSLDNCFSQSPTGQMKLLIVTGAKFSNLRTAFFSPPGRTGDIVFRTRFRNGVHWR